MSSMQLTSDSTERVERVIVVTIGLGATGAVVGAICATSAISLIAMRAGGFRVVNAVGMPSYLAVVAGAGAFTGAIGAPLLGWGLLRRVPLGRVVLYAAIGTVLGAIMGELLHPINPYPRGVPSVIAGAFLGFLAAGIGLRFHARPTTRAPGC
jgi:hypothetical protein